MSNKSESIKELIAQFTKISTLMLDKLSEGVVEEINTPSVLDISASEVEKANKNRVQYKPTIDVVKISEVEAEVLRNKYEAMQEKTESNVDFSEKEIDETIKQLKLADGTLPKASPISVYLSENNLNVNERAYLYMINEISLVLTKYNYKHTSEHLKILFPNQKVNRKNIIRRVE